MSYKHINNYKFGNVFIKTFSIMIVFSMILIFTANYIIYTRSIITLQEQTNKANLNMLYKINESFNQILDQMNQITIQLSLSPKIVNALIIPDMKQFVRNNEIVMELKNVVAINEYISSIYIYIPYNNTIFSSNGGIYELSNFYDKDWILKNFDTSIQTYKLGERKIIDNFKNQAECITIIRNLPYGARSGLGQLVINLNEDKIYRKISSLDIDISGDIYVLNSKNVIILNKDKNKFGVNMSKEPYIQKIQGNGAGYFKETINGRETLFFYITDPNNKWKCIYSIPLKDLGGDKSTVINIILINTVICIALSLILSFVITKGIYRPVQRLVNMVMGSYTKIRLDNINSNIGNEYEFLRYAYSEVIDRNKSIEEFLESVKPTIKEKLFINLLLGRNLSGQEIDDKLSFLNMDLTSSQFIVILVHIDNYSDFLTQHSEVERNIYKIDLMNKIEEIISSKNKGVCIEVDENKIAAIVNIDKSITLLEAKDNAILMAGDIQTKINECFPFTVTLGIGGLYRDVNNIAVSYKEAKNALKYKLYLGENRIIDIENVKVQSEEIYYYSEKEKILINNIKLGQNKEVSIIIDELFEEIQDSGTLPYTYVQQIFNRFLSSIIELIIDNDMAIENVFGRKRNLYEEFSNKETMQDIKIWFTQICSEVVKTINNMNLIKQHRYVEKIKEYIENNSNRDISLNDLAEYVGLNSAYLSKLFKDNFGKNFIDYLNKIRVDKAKQLLENTQLSIKEIGFRIGFNTIQNFMRVFRKYEGITPGQYRELIEARLVRAGI